MQETVVVGLLFFAIAAVMGAVWWGQVRRLRRVAETPTTPIGELKRGFREVVGRVVAGPQIIESPLSRTPCVYYDLVVRERRTHRKKTHWHTVVHDYDCVGLAIEDGSGTCALDIKGAELLLETDHHARSGFLRDAPEHVEQVLRDRYRRSSEGLVFNKSMEYRETVIRPGDKLYVLGTAERAGSVHRFTKADDLYIIADRGEAKALDAIRAKGNHYLIAMIALVALGVLSLLAGPHAHHLHRSKKHRHHHHSEVPAVVVDRG